MSRYILGVSAYFHDSAAALLCDGEIVAAAAEERFTRIKHDSSLPVNAARWCLESQGITTEDLECVVYHEKPLWKFERLIVSQLREFPRSADAFRRTALAWFPEKLWVRNALAKEFDLKRKQLAFCDHHLSHAASAFYSSPFEEAAVLTIDGVGEWATTAMFDAGPNGLKRIAEVRFPHSIGLLYSAFTAYLGFPVNEGEGTVMGLASYGQPIYADDLRRILTLGPQGSFELDLSYFKYHYSASESFSARLEDRFGPARRPYEKLDLATETGQRYANLAASLQLVTEEAILHIASDLQQRTGRKNLCLAGGVALNCVANYRLARESAFERVFVYPAAGDDGCAAGAALWAWNDALKGKRGTALQNSALGKAWSDDEVARTLDEIGATYERLSPDDVAERAVSDLASGKTLGWFQGRFEWGPRALGQRSILADPLRVETRDVVNQKVKFREPFRPFAPAVLQEFSDLYFDIHSAARELTPFMLAAIPALGKAHDDMPATIHVDGSARVQTVHADRNPTFHKLLSEFQQATGRPALLNTSFNLKGEPIVSSPLQALRSFYSSELDAVYIGSCRVPNTAIGSHYYA